MVGIENRKRKTGNGNMGKENRTGELGLWERLLAGEKGIHKEDFRSLLPVAVPAERPKEEELRIKMATSS